MHLACRGGHWAAAVALLSSNVDGLARCKDKRGATPGLLAERAGFGAASVPPEHAAVVVAALELKEGTGEQGGQGAKTLLVQDPTGLQHRTCTPIVRAAHVDPPPENVNRLRVRGRMDGCARIARGWLVCALRVTDRGGGCGIVGG